MELQRENDAATKRVKRGPSTSRPRPQLASAPMGVSMEVNYQRMVQQLEELNSELEEVHTREQQLQQKLQVAKVAEIELIRAQAERDGLRMDLEDHVRVILDLRSTVTRLQVCR